MVKSINENYNKACTEVLVILNNMSEEDKNKIPKKILDELELNTDKEYDFSLDYSKELNKQELNPVAKGILYNLFVEYLASEEKKAEYKAREKRLIEEAEEKKREKYPTDNIFKSNIQEEKSLTVSKNENILQKLIKFIKNLFK